MCSLYGTFLREFWRELVFIFAGVARIQCVLRVNLLDIVALSYSHEKGFFYAFVSIKALKVGNDVIKGGPPSTGLTTDGSQTIWKRFYGQNAVGHERTHAPRVAGWEDIFDMPGFWPRHA